MIDIFIFNGLCTYLILEKKKQSERGGIKDMEFPAVFKKEHVEIPGVN